MGRYEVFIYEWLSYSVSTQSYDPNVYATVERILPTKDPNTDSCDPHT